jgi:hypothetical protein
MDMIFSYSRREAIEDGVLVDVTDQAKARGFKVSVCLSSAAYGVAVDRKEQGEGDGFRTLDDRLADVLEAALMAARQQQEGDRASFKVYRMRDAGRETIDLYAHIGPGDEGEPVVTIMIVGED